MNWVAWPLSLAALVGALWHSRDEPVVLIIGGDQGGYLTPCGCADPMTGGIERKVAVVLAQGDPDQVVYIESGGLVEETNRQAELKLEALGEAFRLAGVDALGLGAGEASLGSGAVESLRRLSGDALTSLSLRESDTNAIAHHKVAGQFLIGSAAVEPAQVAGPIGELTNWLDPAVDQLVKSARARNLEPILMLRGNKRQAERVARDHPDLALVVFSSESQPAAEPTKIGDTWLVSPGHHGRHVLRLTWDGEFLSYSPIALTPNVPSSDGAEEVLLRYARRVDEEDLLERMPRLPGPEFAGNKICGSCHADALDVWLGTTHSSALKTLEEIEHDRDPECVGCHVVGLSSVNGFRSRDQTPSLTDVGCESCHGAGKDHALKPMEVEMPQVGAAACRPCHDLDHSPSFTFEEYWKRVSH